MVFEHVGGDAHDLLVELFEDRLVLVLLGVVDLDVLEERLDVAVDPAVLDRHLGVDGEGPGRDVELAVGAEDVVDLGERSLLDR